MRDYLVSVVARVSNPVKKGDFVALQTHHTTFYINPARSEPREEWQIVKVTSASRAGETLAVGGTDVKHIPWRPKIHTMVNHQKGAAALFDAGMVWHSAEAIKAAILAAEGITA